eukprot:CAMPEP_0172323528 /NCGR_PEP_ID=MMETSP1058-20130122/48960_1 /TAXON_ID=83371 /ORGANISM="Detonula confervacea, Strain CCMP 353" /LENGTH=581 /DNA_ID=CAMNT_0013039549 /DNA_START=13 /DNA_END=1754 /DNA_ORIENTATION=+
MTIILMPQWLALMNPPPLDIVAATLFIGYILFEVGFFFHYHWNLVPFANQILSRSPAPYRDYMDVKDREKLLVRILDRLIERERIPTQNSKTDDPKQPPGSDGDIYYKFIESWFQKKNNDAPYERFSEQFDMATLGVPPPPLIRMAWSSLGGNTSVDDESNKSSSESLSVLGGELSEKDPNRIIQNECHDNKDAKPGSDRIQKGNMDEFLSYAFFAVPFSTVQASPAMQQALDNLYNILQNRPGMNFEPGTNPNYRPRAIAFEKVKSLYRPYGVYASVALMRMTANCILYVLGFRQYSCKRGLKYWHRPAKQQLGSPFLFFHGIAPGGHAPYLPMIFLGILRGQLSHRHRDIFLFENKPISYALCFDALSEEDTVHGVLEAINHHLDTISIANNLTLCGHSFGSVALTWLVKSPKIKNMISTLILLDPVSILLSEPDLMVNFLYSRQEIDDPYDGNTNSWTDRLIRCFNETKIRLVASSEMFIEHYLRRNFAWYNAEIWFQDIPHHVRVVVCLAACDEIVNTPKIEKEIAIHNSKVSRDKHHGALVEHIVWRDVGHAHCVTNPDRWGDIHHAMRKIESRVL